MTRNIIYKLVRQGIPLAGARIKLRLLTDGATLSDGSVPRYDHVAYTDHNGEATITVDVPVSPYSWLYSCEVDKNNVCTFPLGVGSDITWVEIQDNLCGLEANPIQPSQVCGYFMVRDVVPSDYVLVINENCQYIVANNLDNQGEIIADGSLVII